jgi:hypothetical protein
VALAAALVWLAFITGCGNQPPAGALRAAKSQPGTGAAGRGAGVQTRNGSPAGGALAARSGVGFHPPGNASGVVDGAMFGGNAGMASASGELSRRLAIARVYYDWGEKFPMPLHRSWMAKGITLLVSLDTGYSEPNYASVAAGHYDSYVRGFLSAMNQAAYKYHLGAIYFCFQHEANAVQHHPVGSPAQFVSAWDHIHQLAAAAHLNWNDGGRIHWVYILTHEAYVLPMSARPRWAQRMGSADAYWPGNRYVDIVAADGYVSYGCKVGQPAGGSLSDPASAQSLFGPLLGFARSHGGLPVFIAEWGATYFPTSQRQVTFIHQMQAFVNANRQVRAVMYWDSLGIGPHCNYSINGNPPSITAMRALAHSTLLQGHTV